MRGSAWSAGATAAGKRYCRRHVKKGTVSCTEACDRWRLTSHFCAAGRCAVSVRPCKECGELVCRPCLEFHTDRVHTHHTEEEAEIEEGPPKWCDADLEPDYSSDDDGAPDSADDVVPDECEDDEPWSYDYGWKWVEVDYY